MEEEFFYTCPYCFTEVSIIADKSVRKQSYIEDCERCCNPIEFTIVVEACEIVHFDAEAIGQ